MRPRCGRLVVGEVPGVEESRRNDLAIGLADHAGDGRQILAVREAADAVNPPLAQILTRHANPAGHLGFANAVGGPIPVDQLDEAGDCHTAKYSATVCLRQVSVCTYANC